MGDQIHQAGEKRISFQSTPVEGMAAGSLRRLGAVLYDTLLGIGIAALVIIVLMIVTFPFLPSAREHMLVASEIGPVAYIYPVGAIAVVFLHIGYCWTKKGQTLGMQVWRIRIETFGGGLPNWRDCFMRIVLMSVIWSVPLVLLKVSEQQSSAILKWVGVTSLILPLSNYFIAAFDEQRRSWHDRFLQTRVVRQKK
jgi:uncharacterized RDD family membrane protein YckC